MADVNQLPERIFLTQVVIEEHNYQTGAKLDWENMEIFSIQPLDGFAYGYEINSMKGYDDLRIQYFFNKGEQDFLSKYRIEVKPVHRAGTPGGDVFVYRGTLNTAHTYYDGYQLLWMGRDPNSYPYLLQTDRQPITTVDGDYLSLV